MATKAKKYRRYSKRYDEQVLEMFEMGLSAVRISESLDVPIVPVYKTIRTKYPEWDGRKVLPIKELVTLYKKGATAESLADKYGVSHKTITSRLEEEGVEVRSTGEAQRVHFFNEDFFETIDTPEKAYWLGFMFADGNVSSRMLDVSIAIKESDRDHLEKFLESVEYTGPGGVMTCKGKSFSKEFTYYKVGLRSAKMCSDLVDKGCIPNKSLDLHPPEGVPGELIMDFIRGVVDGDGYVSKAGPMAIEIVGARALLEWISSEISLMSPPRPHKSIWRVRANGDKAEEILSKLYTEAEVYMGRKREAAMRNV